MEVLEKPVTDIPELVCSENLQLIYTNGDFVGRHHPIYLNGLFGKPATGITECVCLENLQCIYRNGDFEEAVYSQGGHSGMVWLTGAAPPWGAVAVGGTVRVK